MSLKEEGENIPVRDTKIIIDDGAKVIHDKATAQILEVVFPSWLPRNDKKWMQYTNMITEGHASLENTLNVSIAGCLINREGEEKDQLQQTMSYVDFARKITVAKELGIITDAGSFHKINEFRVVHAHYKHRDSKWQNTRENKRAFKKFYNEAQLQIVTWLVQNDPRIVNDMVRGYNKLLEKLSR